MKQRSRTSRASFIRPQAQTEVLTELPSRSAAGRDTALRLRDIPTSTMADPCPPCVVIWKRPETACKCIASGEGCADPCSNRAAIDPAEPGNAGHLVTPWENHTHSTSFNSAAVTGGMHPFVPECNGPKYNAPQRPSSILCPPLANRMGGCAQRLNVVFSLAYCLSLPASDENLS